MKPPILLILLLMSFSAFGQKSELISKRNFGELLMKKNLNHSEYYSTKNKPADYSISSKKTNEIFRMKSVAETKQKLDSAIVWWVDEDSGMLIRFMKRECYYNSDGLSTSEIQYFYNEDVEKLVPEVKQEYSFDTQGNILQVLIYAWAETNTWTYESKITNTFNTNNKISEQLTYTWNNYSNSWLKDKKQEFKYDANGNLYQELYYYWDADLNQWTNTNKSTHTYNANNERTLSQYFSLNSNNQMVVIGKTEFTFSNGLVSQTIHYERDEYLNQWYIVGRYDYTYDTYGNMEQELGYYWDEETNQYAYESKIDISYDYTYLMSEINLPVSFFVDDEFISETNHKVDSLVGFYWDDELNDWSAFLKSVYYYSESTVSLVDDINKHTIKIFPNPVQDYLYITIPGNSSSFGFELYDISGHSLLNIRLSNYSPVDLKYLSQGMYFYKIVSLKNDEIRGKLIKD